MIATRRGFLAPALALAAALAGGCGGPSPPPPDPADYPDEYTGSAACRDCHLEIHDRWRETLMANVLVDPA